MKPRYSGKLSESFWDKINSIKDEKLWSKIHLMGVKLQNLEEKLLKELDKEVKP